ncbi:hypothetical protein PGT21_019258 [Puccinia graminis f. sp. tritici]|uniref:NEDD8-activating enzyme E1 catalytic subunit n=2 Tax=Puccinia graminis f. sp. tritici TaxID=56615 RepID=E3L5S4_PUCGT|nr:ubiquitin-activating enzyme E1 C [Puccinia graminis f. sp. tritici CRL 75-36-700-3]EFP91899.2 ubiquitin-activating enzyme E1 C [Puccinia graminis f. sp. tritici CRL 75-36-700-3]KAA1076792.1 hypothetical protein PGT21_019258 [Puccinia graminis f. sp. tritici]KAA1126957.1 hypothetical protein PGTUg99_050111 [Puccinia graminis f. sp. tritici]
MGRKNQSNGGAGDPNNDTTQAAADPNQDQKPPNDNLQADQKSQQQMKKQSSPPKPKTNPRAPTPPPSHEAELEEQHYYHVDKLLDRTGPMVDSSFETGSTPKDFIRKTCKVLVIGAGGLGCEILQNLALLGFGDIHVIDMDTIDISNLNRQFLFREKDIGQPKADVAAKFIMQRVPQVKVTPHYCKIQDKDEAFYMMFNLVICGLDSVPARRWINATIVNLVDPENPDSYKPLIDGGTEGFKGQSRVILPTITSCYECSLDMLTPQTVFPICTIANTPRLPEHCIEWASVLEWPRVFKDKKLDNDNPDHIQWLFEQASTRAEQHHISGVTWSLTQGVVKNIIPAIASTNAIIAASCCNEAFKIATSCAPYLKNYMMYNGSESIYTYTFQHEKKPDCPVCGGESVQLTISKDWFLQQLVDHLVERPDFQIKQPSLSTPKGPLFFQGPPELRKATELNLDKKLLDLFPDHLQDPIEITVTDSSLPFQLSLLVKLH